MSGIGPYPPLPAFGPHGSYPRMSRRIAQSNRRKEGRSFHCRARAAAGGKSCITMKMTLKAGEQSPLPDSVSAGAAVCRFAARWSGRTRRLRSLATQCPVGGVDVGREPFLAAPVGVFGHLHVLLDVIQRFAVLHQLADP